MKHLLISKFKPVFILLVLIMCVSGLNAQNIPDKPNPPKLVNDFAGILDENTRMALENELVKFNDQTSSQIAIVTVNSLDGADADQYAFLLGEKWGIGQKGKNNGILILIKPKTGEERGAAFIATGYGLEGAVPDGICSQIVNNEMIPRFKQNDYAGGIVAAVKVIEDLTRGEYTADEYSKKAGKGSPLAGVILILIIVIIVAVIARSNKSRTYSSSGSSLPFWLLMGGMAASSRNHHGSWGNFSGGSGGFGGGGGFGGFGGGSFGGGGAGGSW
jgi:uncharacterized protein